MVTTRLQRRSRDGDQEETGRSADRQKLQACKRQLAHCREELVRCKAQLEERDRALVESEEKLQAKLARCRGVLKDLQERYPCIPRYIPGEGEYAEARERRKRVGQMQKFRHRDRGMQEIIPDVWLGGKQDARVVDEKFKLVMNCTPDIPFVKQGGVRNVPLPVPDGQGEEQNAAIWSTCRV